MWRGDDIDHNRGHDQPWPPMVGSFGGTHCSQRHFTGDGRNFTSTSEQKLEVGEVQWDSPK